MGEAVLNGWTAARLDDLRDEVMALREAVESLRDSEVKDLKEELADARDQSRKARAMAKTTFQSFAAPIIASCVTIILLAIAHALHVA